MYDAEQQDNLTWASIATLCELGEEIWVLLPDDWVYKVRQLNFF